MRIAKCYVDMAVTETERWWYSTATGKRSSPSRNSGGPRRPLLFALGSLRTNRQVDVIGGEVPSAEPIGAAPASRLRETVGALGLELVVTA